MSNETTPKKKKFHFSFSSITKLMRDPKAFYNEYILGNYDDTSKKFLDVGTIAHSLVLNPEDFYDQIVVMNCKVPSDNVRAIIDNVYKLYGEDQVKDNPMALLDLSNFDREIIEELLKADLYQSLTDSVRADKQGNKFTGDEKRLQKVITDETQAYFAILGTGYRKTIVDYGMIEKATKKANAVKENKRAAFLMEEQEGEEMRMEMDLRCNLGNYPFGLRGIIDNLKVNNKKRKITINDLKTTSKTLQKWYEDFNDSPYMYWMQPIVYKELLLSLLPKDDLSNWTLEVNFIVVDCNDDVYCFNVTPQSLAKWEVETKKVYDKAAWHLANNEYTLPYEFLNNLVQL